MYWPLGTPRIFSAKVINSITTYDSDDNHEDEALVAVSPSNDIGDVMSSSGSKKAVQSDNLLPTGDSAQEVQDVEEREGQEDEASVSRAHRSRREFLGPHHTLGTSLQGGNKSGSSLDVTFSEELNVQAANGAILALKMSRNGALFATITVTEMTIWQTKVREHFMNIFSVH